jgi:hypothetical protein
MTGRTDTGQFSKGHSGNQAGKPKGARNKATLLALELFEGESEALCRKAVELALGGDTTALRLCLERIAPVVKERPVCAIELPQFNDPKSALVVLEQIAEKLSAGGMLPSEAAAICQVLEQHRRHYETNEIDERLVAMERTLKMRKK